jgi:hypothetical protein
VLQQTENLALADISSAHDDAQLTIEPEPYGVETRHGSAPL